MNDTKPDPNAEGTPTPEADPEIDLAADAPETEDPTVAEDEATAEAVDELTSLKDQLLRAMAETENVRNRAKREREDATEAALLEANNLPLIPVSARYESFLKMSISSIIVFVVEARPALSVCRANASTFRAWPLADSSLVASHFLMLASSSFRLLNL